MNDLERKDIELLSFHSDMDRKDIQTSLEKHTYPNQDAWASFIRITLITLAIGFMAAGIVFFFAYNWADLDKLIKLGIVQGLVIGCIILMLVLRIDPLYKQIILTAASLLVGVLFAVFGQVYQTGADAYDFFLAWTIFITIWVLVANFPPLWLCYIGLVNLTIFLFYEQVAQHMDFIYVASGIFVLNAAILALSVWLKEQQGRSIPTYFTNLLGLAAAIWSIYANLFWILEARNLDAPMILAATALFYALGIRYGIRKKSAFYLGLIPFSCVIILSGVLIKISDSTGMVLFISAFIITSVSFIVWNILKMQRRVQNER